MRTRIITAVVAITCIFPIFWFSEPLGIDHPLSYLFPLLFALISLVSVWEMLHCIGLDRNWFVSLPLYSAAFAAPLLMRVMRGHMRLYVRAALLFAMVFAVYLFAVIVFHYGKVNIGKFALAFMTCFYIIGANAAVIYLRDVPQPGVGRLLFVIPFIFAWITDTFAYFCGRLFGKHKLIPNVSPKKTVEGAVGGFVFCAVTAVVYGVIVSKCFHVTPNYWVLGLGGIAIGVVSQIGDLIMSAIKRDAGVKDYGWMLPGHGGLLDRFDSSMAVTVLLTVLTCYCPLFR